MEIKFSVTIRGGRLYSGIFPNTYSIWNSAGSVSLADGNGSWAFFDNNVLKQGTGTNYTLSKWFNVETKANTVYKPDMYLQNFLWVPFDWRYKKEQLINSYAQDTWKTRWDQWVIEVNKKGFNPFSHNYKTSANFVYGEMALQIGSWLTAFTLKHKVLTNDFDVYLVLKNVRYANSTTKVIYPSTYSPSGTASTPEDDDADTLVATYEVFDYLLYSENRVAKTSRQMVDELRLDLGGLTQSLFSLAFCLNGFQYQLPPGKTNEELIAQCLRLRHMTDDGVEQILRLPMTPYKWDTKHNASVRDLWWYIRRAVSIKVDINNKYTYFLDAGAQQNQEIWGTIKFSIPSSYKVTRLSEDGAVLKNTDGSEKAFMPPIKLFLLRGVVHKSLRKEAYKPGQKWLEPVVPAHPLLKDQNAISARSISAIRPEGFTYPSGASRGSPQNLTHPAGRKGVIKLYNPDDPMASSGFGMYNENVAVETFKNYLYRWTCTEQNGMLNYEVKIYNSPIEAPVTITTVANKVKSHFSIIRVGTQARGVLGPAWAFKKHKLSKKWKNSAPVQHPNTISQPDWVLGYTLVVDPISYGTNLTHYPGYWNETTQTWEKDSKFINITTNECISHWSERCSQSQLFVIKDMALPAFFVDPRLTPTM